MAKITIVREQLVDGLRWRVQNWDDYLGYLEKNNLPKPVTRYAIFASYETHGDYELLIGDFDKQVPILYRLREGEIEYDIVDG